MVASIGATASGRSWLTTTSVWSTAAVPAAVVALKEARRVRRGAHARSRRQAPHDPAEKIGRRLLDLLVRRHEQVLERACLGCQSCSPRPARSPPGTVAVDLAPAVVRGAGLGAPVLERPRRRRRIDRWLLRDGHDGSLRLTETYPRAEGPNTARPDTPPTTRGASTPDEQPAVRSRAGAASRAWGSYCCASSASRAPMSRSATSWSRAACSRAVRTISAASLRAVATSSWASRCARRAVRLPSGPRPRGGVDLSVGFVRLQPGRQPRHLVAQPVRRALHRVTVDPDLAHLGTHLLQLTLHRGQMVVDIARVVTAPYNAEKGLSGAAGVGRVRMVASRRCRSPTVPRARSPARYPPQCPAGTARHLDEETPHAVQVMDVSGSGSPAAQSERTGEPPRQARVAVRHGRVHDRCGAASSLAPRPRRTPLR